jgi:N-acetylglucosaminyldiphosphoundecaprenol N-acetyl-beta-D-mannosaminyltransferase
VNSADVIGTEIFSAPLDEVVDELEQCIGGIDREYVCFANAHLTATARRDPQTARALGGATMVLADGAPVAWAIRLLTGEAGHRIAGADVFDELCRRSQGRGHRHFFLGSTSEVLASLEEGIAERYPGMVVCGSYSPPFGPALFDELEKTARRINATRPDVVWVGLGAPRQEQWMEAARPLLRAPLLLGVGAVFEFTAGTKRRAPGWMQRAGLEWVFRLLQEPRRLFRRYLVTNTAFSFALARQLLGRANVG